MLTPEPNPHVAAVPSKDRRLLSITIAYYIRKLLHQNFDRLTSVVATGAGLKADALSDLDSVIESLYLEEQEVSATVHRIESLAAFHQTMSHQGAKHRQDLQNVEQQIFWLLGFKLKQLPQLGTVLIVDDSHLNVHLLSTALTEHGYATSQVDNGRLSLIQAETLKPDLILLDIMMPDVDGYEVCKQLKSNPVTCDIPVLFISTIDLVLDKVKAFSLGAVDYITKPFQLEEVLARVDLQIKLRHLQKRLEEQNIRLQHEIQERKKAESAVTTYLQMQSLTSSKEQHTEDNNI